MSNPPKRKGTDFERKVERRFQDVGFKVTERKTAGARYDMKVTPPHVDGYVREYPQEPISALVTEPGRGQPLAVITLGDLMFLLDTAQMQANVECKKRGGALWHHSTFKEKFE